MKDLIRLMLVVRPAERPDIDTVLERLGLLATNLKADAAPASLSQAPAASRPFPTPPQASQVVSSNPQDLVSTPASTPGHALPARRASSGSLKLGREGTGTISRSSSPASGMAPLSPQHPRQAGQTQHIAHNHPVWRAGCWVACRPHIGPMSMHAMVSVSINAIVYATAATPTPLLSTIQGSSVQPA